MRKQEVTLDWSLSDAENARLTGLDPSTINRHRHKAGITPATPKKRQEWDKAPWHLTDRDIASRMGCTVGAVTAARHRLRKPPVPAPSKFALVDWTKTNDQIIKEIGGTLSSIRTARSRMGGTGKAQRKPHESQLARMKAKLSERKTVHQWLNTKGTPTHENGKPLCLLRRLAIALNIHDY